MCVHKDSLRAQIHTQPITRQDGPHRRETLQWAYKGQPVYMRFHDLPLGPYAKEIEGFRLLQP